jgi:cobalt-zinc-cadmium resistance protein CzcA
VFSGLVMKQATGRNNRGSTEPGVVRALIRVYRPLVAFFVHQRGAAVALGCIMLVAGLLIFPQLGAEFTPKLREGTIVVRLTMAPSISITQSKRNALIVERRLLQIPEVVEVTSRVGRGEVGAHADPINSAEMFVLLKPNFEWRKPNDQDFIEAEIRDQVSQLPGIRANLTQPIEMTVDELLEGVRAELAIKLFGDDLDMLKRKADAIAARSRCPRCGRCPGGSGQRNAATADPARPASRGPLRHEPRGCSRHHPGRRWRGYGQTGFRGDPALRYLCTVCRGGAGHP